MKLSVKSGFPSFRRIYSPSLGSLSRISFAKSGMDGTGVSYALHSLSDDPYIELIYLLYRDRKTIEWIAEYYDVSDITIKRNKKRLIQKLYELLETI